MTTGKALVISSQRDGPWVPVVGLASVVVEGLEPDNEIRLVSRDRTLLAIRDNGIHSVNMAEGDVRIERVAGESRVTVRALEEPCLSIR